MRCMDWPCATCAASAIPWSSACTMPASTAWRRFAPLRANGCAAPGVASRASASGCNCADTTCLIARRPRARSGIRMSWGRNCAITRACARCCSSCWPRPRCGCAMTATWRGDWPCMCVSSASRHVTAGSMRSSRCRIRRPCCMCWHASCVRSNGRSAVAVGIRVDIRRFRSP